MGLVLDVVITAASVQDRQVAPAAAVEHPPRLPPGAPGLGRCRTTGKLSSWAAAMKMTLQIVSKRNPRAFEVLPRR